MAKIHWDIHRWDTEYVLDNLHDYIEMIEGQFERVRELERKRIPRKPPIGLSEEEFAEWQSALHFFEARYEKDFPSKIRYSFIVLLHIVIETRLRAVCNEISKRKSIELRERDLKGPAIERAGTFLEKIAKVPVKDQKAWQWLKDFQKVRDCVVHTNGEIELSRDKKRLNQLCCSGIGLSTEANSLMIQRHYCTKTVEIARAFFDQLFDAAGFGPSMPVVT